MPPLMCSCNMLQSLSDFGRHKTDGKRRETDGKRRETDGKQRIPIIPGVYGSCGPRLCKAMIHALCHCRDFLFALSCGIFENSSHGRSSLAESPRNCFLLPLKAVDSNTQSYAHPSRVLGKHALNSYGLVKYEHRAWPTETIRTRRAVCK